jgi:methylenetetrahydrofolate reductase (NADPH)
MPVMNFASVRRMSAMCGTAVPAWLETLFAGLDDLPAARQLVAATVAAELCRRLYAGGVRQFHFYTLNRAELSYAICHLLGLRPQGATLEQAA